MTPRASVIIPTYQHADTLREAAESALAQTTECEVIVVDDGSTDATYRVLFQGVNALAADERVHVISLRHGGPAKARNAGLDAARGEFVMFLDADDVIAPTKIERQLQAFDDSVGWVLCDVEIVEADRGRRQLASERYRYAERNLGGWIREQLAVSNFIPIMAPLIRRSALSEDVRFTDAHPEDWHFWYRLAAHARMRYIPDVLATYRKRRGSRNQLGIPTTPPALAAGRVLLNLGCGTPGAASWHPMPACINLDRALGWMFEDGLPQFADGAVDGITISHALMYVEEEDWPRVFAEFARVLRRGAVLRITEDDTVDPRSRRRGGWRGSEPAVTLTSPAFVRAFLEDAGFAVHDCTAETTLFEDRSLVQAQHGAVPDVFFVEGVKP